MSAGRAAGDRNEGRIPAVLGDVLAHPGQRALGIDDVRRPSGGRTQAVVDGGHHPAALRKVADQRQCFLVLFAKHPRAAVNVQQHRASWHDRPGRPDDVEMIEDAVLAVGDVVDRRDAAALEVQRPRPFADGDSGAQRGRALRQNALAVVGAERVLQYAFQRRSVAPGAAVRDRHRRNSEQRECQARTPGARVERTEPDQQRTSGHTERHHRNHEFGTDQAEREPPHRHRVLARPASHAGAGADCAEGAEGQQRPAGRRTHVRSLTA